MSIPEPMVTPVALVDERTRDILARRRATDMPRRRGWLVRRMLLLADVFGLCVAFVVAQSLVALPIASTVESRDTVARRSLISK